MTNFALHSREYARRLVTSLYEFWIRFGISPAASCSMWCCCCLPDEQIFEVMLWLEIPVSSADMSPADIPSRAESDEPSKDQPAAQIGLMRTSVRMLAGTAAAASLLLALTTALIWATGVAWHVDQPQDTTSSVFVSVDVHLTGTWGGPNVWTALLLLATPLAAAALAGMGALRQRPRLIRLSTPPAAVAFAVTWAFIVSAYIWGGIHQTINADDHLIPKAYGHLVPLRMEPRPRIEATWPAALLFSAVALVAASGAWWVMRRARSTAVDPTQ